MEIDDSANRKCAFCQQSNGFLTKCASPKCDGSFHVLCGLFGGGRTENGNGILCRRHIPILQSRGSGGIHGVTPYFMMLKMSKISTEMDGVFRILKDRQSRNKAMIQNVIQRIKQRLDTMNPVPSSPGTPDSKLIVDEHEAMEQNDETADVLMNGQMDTDDAVAISSLNLETKNEYKMAMMEAMESLRDSVDPQLLDNAETKTLNIPSFDALPNYADAAADALNEIDALNRDHDPRSPQNVRFKNGEAVHELVAFSKFLSEETSDRFNRNRMK